jgi:hypothetical protein
VKIPIKHWSMIDGTTYIVKVFFKTNTKENGMGKTLQLATRELGNPIAE